MSLYKDWLLNVIPPVFQEEQYDHLDEADVNKVDKLTNDTMIWMNSAMNQQSKQSLTVDPSVKAKDIRAKTRVSVYLGRHHHARALRLGACLVSTTSIYFCP